MSQNSDSNHQSQTHGLTLVIDPFKLGPEHGDHKNSDEIILLCESGKIFCPTCLSQSLDRGQDTINRNLLSQYIRNMYDILDRYSDNLEIKKIALQTIRIVLMKTPLSTKSDHEFHNQLRIFHKIMNSVKFDSQDFSNIVDIFSIVSENYAESNPMPLSAVWKAIQQMLTYVENKLQEMVFSEEPELNTKSCRIFLSATKLLQCYLKILARFTNVQNSHTMFSLYIDHDQQAIKPECFKPSLCGSLDFMTSKLLPRVRNLLSEFTRPLSIDERSMLDKLFQCLTECFKTSLSVDYKQLHDYLIEIDIIFICHTLIYKNSDRTFRKPLKDFLHMYVKHYIEYYFSSEDYFIEFMNNSELVETNHKNALVFSTESERYVRTSFYILVNCIAIKHHSRYYQNVRVCRVIKAINPDKLQMKSSRTQLRAYLFLSSRATDRLSTSENVYNFVDKLLNSMVERSNYERFSQLFCFDEKVMCWAQSHNQFTKLINNKTIEYVLKWSKESGSLQQNFLQLMNFKNHVTLYLKNENSAVDIVKAVVSGGCTGVDVAQQTKSHELLINNLSSILMAAFHSIILRGLNKFSPGANTRAQRVINLIIILMQGCKHFNIVLDDQFIDDLIKLLERLYQSPSTHEAEDTLIMMNEFITQLMLGNNPYLMKLLKKLDYTVLGYMYSRLADYTMGDHLAESIAKLLVTYDSIDYPLIQNIGKSLNAMALSVVNWMLSRNDNLHILSLLIAQNILDAEQHDNSTKACVTTGLIHMLYDNPHILNERIHLDKLLSMIKHDAFKYNPLVTYLLEIESPKIRRAIEKELTVEYNAPPSPALSFISSENDLFEEQHCSITQILSHLNDTESIIDRIPDSLYIHGIEEDEFIGANNTEEWERRAYDINKNAEAF